MSTQFYIFNHVFSYTCCMRSTLIRPAITGGKKVDFVDFPTTKRYNAMVGSRVSEIIIRNHCLRLSDPHRLHQSTGCWSLCRFQNTKIIIFWNLNGRIIKCKTDEFGSQNKSCYIVIIRVYFNIYFLQVL